MAKTLRHRLKQAREIRDALLDRLEGRAGENHNSYSIDDRSISKMSISEVRIEYEKMHSHVKRLEKEDRLGRGLGGSVRIRG